MKAVPYLLIFIPGACWQHRGNRSKLLGVSSMKKLLYGFLFAILILFAGEIIMSQDGPRDENEQMSPSGQIPFMMVCDEGLMSGKELTETDLTKPKKDRVILGYWDLKDGKILWDEKPIFKREVNRNATIKTVWDGGKRVGFVTDSNQQSPIMIKEPHPDFEVEIIRGMPLGITQALSSSEEVIAAYPIGDNEETRKIAIEIHTDFGVKKKVLTHPSWSKGDFVDPILVYGQPDNVNVLLSVEQKDSSKLMLASIKGDQAGWSEIKDAEGVFQALIAGPGADTVKLSEKIYLGRRLVTEIKLAGNRIASVQNYSPANDLIKKIEAQVVKATDTAVQARLGSFDSKLLVRIPSTHRDRIWAIEKDKNIGALMFDIEEGKIKAYQEGKLTDERILPDGFKVLLWPDEGCGTINGSMLE